jgi:hypothetical protein
LDLCRKLARFCADKRAVIESCDPELPAGAFNRIADNWRPLFAIAEVAGGDWPERAASAFGVLTSREDEDAQGIGMMLLADIRRIFDEIIPERIFSKRLVESLCAMSDRPWRQINRGAITENWLSRRLRPFGVHSSDIHLDGKHAKGYARANFAEAFERYLPDFESSNRANVQSSINTGENENSKRADGEVAHGLKTAQSAINIGFARLHVSESADLVIGEI